MNATYALLGIPFLAVSLVVWLVARRLTGGPGLRATGLAMAAILLMTAVFDSLIVGVGIVGYDESLISGIRVGTAPVEDLFYAVAAVLLLPAVHRLLRPRTTP